MARSIDGNDLVMAKLTLVNLASLSLRQKFAYLQVKPGFCRGSCLNDFVTPITRTAALNDQVVAFQSKMTEGFVENG